VQLESHQQLKIQTALRVMREAAKDERPVSGLTHQHYRYPARFSPSFVSAAIELFSSPGDVVLDPYMGGGTTIVEAFVAGRQAFGCDLNSLAVFVAKAKTVTLAVRDVQMVEEWARQVVPDFRYYDKLKDQSVFCDRRTRNLNLPRVRALKKLIALTLESYQGFHSEGAELLARCALLNVSQWALNGRKRIPSLEEFRERLSLKTLEMLKASQELDARIRRTGLSCHLPNLIHGNANQLGSWEPFAAGALTDLVVTSPPYPGVHILYHRWQVDGRRETPAPYWIANCLDGQGHSYYNFGDRNEEAQDAYFHASLATLRAIRQVMRSGATIVQMLSFARPRSHLPRYLQNMREAGFSELRLSSAAHARIWRRVPRRSWHANSKGNISSAREVVLVHRAV
jgi:DNA modification methylase